MRYTSDPLFSAWLATKQFSRHLDHSTKTSVNYMTMLLQTLILRCHTTPLVYMWLITKIKEFNRQQGVVLLSRCQELNRTCNPETLGANLGNNWNSNMQTFKSILSGTQPNIEPWIYYGKFNLIYRFKNLNVSVQIAW